MSDKTELVVEDGRAVGRRTAGSRTIDHYGMSSTDIAVAQISDKHILEAYDMLRRSVLKKGFALDDPRLRLELHFIREDRT